MSTENSNQSWASQHTGALIGASGAIIAAIIAGIFLMASQKEGSIDAIKDAPHTPEVQKETTQVLPKKKETISDDISEVITTEFELASYKKVYDFAYTAGGMNQSSSDSTKFADSWISNCPKENFSKFIEAYKFAYSAGGLNMSSSSAKEWASNKFRCLN